MLSSPFQYTIMESSPDQIHRKCYQSAILRRDSSNDTVAMRTSRQDFWRQAISSAHACSIPSRVSGVKQARKSSIV